MITKPAAFARDPGERRVTRAAFRALLLCLLTTPAAGCGATGGTGRSASPPAGGPAAAGPAPTNAARFTAADVHFISGMIGHHAQAIEMARLAPTRAGSEPVRTLAARIISTQQDEIALMQQWLRERGQPVPEARPTRMMTMTMGGMEHEMPMPGVLTDEQMRQLGAASGNEFDRLFLTFMIQHHRGAVAMVTELFRNNGAGQDDAVFKLASDVNVDQTTEIARMQRMLVDLVTVSPTP
jgi:uncharacterized protein (DUF305 family)